jgi:hypothetical protein
VTEIGNINEVWNDTIQEASGLSTQLTGLDASETAFKLLAPGQRVLHLATHGFFLSDQCVDDTITQRSVVDVLETHMAEPLSRSDSDDERLDPELVEFMATSPPVSHTDPLLLSGLALTGANSRFGQDLDAPARDDGILTAEEVSALDLSGVEWVVLSACDTGTAAGSNSIATGESLRRAFQAAGAQTVIMSLWDVEDGAAQEWMTALYESRFRANLSTADAVKHASLTMLQERKAQGEVTHPFFWAPFIAVGAWQ